MAGRQIYNPDGFKNVEENGKITGYQFQFKAQYYRGFTLSIVRDIQVNVDGEDAAREDIRFTVNGETFTLEEMRTVTVQKEGGLAKGAHHIKAMQIIAPSYMPFQTEALCEADFEIA